MVRNVLITMEIDGDVRVFNSIATNAQILALIASKQVYQVVNMSNGKILSSDAWDKDAVREHSPEESTVEQILATIAPKEERLSEYCREAVCKLLAARRYDTMFGDGMEADYVWDGADIKGLNQLTEEELLDEAQQVLGNDHSLVQQMLMEMKVDYIKLGDAVTCKHCGRTGECEPAFCVEENDNG